MPGDNHNDAYPRPESINDLGRFLWTLPVLRKSSAGDFLPRKGVEFTGLCYISGGEFPPETGLC
jgi:hypothetical protein